MRTTKRRIQVLMIDGEKKKREIERAQVSMIHHCGGRGKPEKGCGIMARLCNSDESRHLDAQSSSWHLLCMTEATIVELSSMDGA